MARHRHRRVVSVTLALSVALTVGGCGFFGGGDDHGRQPAATSDAAPSATAPAEPVFAPIVKPAPGSWTTEFFVPGSPIPWRHGIFFTDNITGRTKGWSVAAVPQQRPDPPPTPGPDGFDPEPSIYQYSLGGGGRWVWTIAQGREPQAYLLNRETSEAWTWDWNKLGLDGASRDFLLFEQAVGPDPHQHSTGKYLATDAALNVLSTFELTPSWFAPNTYVSNDGKAAIWVTRRDEPNRKLEHKLYLVDLPTGTAREVYVYEVELVGKNFEQTAFVGSNASEEAIVVTITRPEAPGEPLARIPRATEEVRFNWQGDRTGETSDPGGHLSPDGQYIVYETFTRFQGGGGGEGGGDRWPVVTLAKSDGTEVFRILSASMSFGDGMPGERWLADSNGFVVLLDNSGESPGWPGDNIGYAIVRLDGSIEPLPALPAMPEPNRWFESTLNRGPEPHPTDPNLIAFGHFELLNVGRAAWRGSPYFADDQGPMHVGPWVEGVEDRVSAIPHGGHGGWGPPVLLGPLVQHAPFAEPHMVVAPGGCLNLRDNAGLDAAVITCLAPGTPLQLAELPGNLEPGTAEYFEARVVRISESGTWLNVTQGGWVNAAFVRWAE